MSWPTELALWAQSRSSHWPAELPPAREFVRGVAFALALYWALRGLRRMWADVRRYDRLAQNHGLSPGLVKRCAWRILLRATLLEPLNLLLLLAILGLNLGFGLGL